MRGWISCCIVVAFLFVLTGAGNADIKLRVEKSAMAVSSSAAGTVVVWGSPGSVYGVHPVNYVVYNKDLKVSSAGFVNSDGSFSTRISGYADDDLKIRFTAANGKRKSVRLEVPKYTVPAPVIVVPSTVGTTVIDTGTVTETTTILPPYTVQKETVVEEVEVVQ